MRRKQLPVIHRKGQKDLIGTLVDSLWNLKEPFEVYKASRFRREVCVL
jgi:hypothetical protein